MVYEENDRIRNSTSEQSNRLIDAETLHNIYAYQHKTVAEIHERIAELDLEWDIERVLTLNASTLALTGLVLGVSKDRRWLGVPAVVLAFLFQHSVQGWCPPLPLFRKFGVRTRGEIDHEKFALLELIREQQELSDNHEHIDNYVP